MLMVKWSVAAVEWMGDGLLATLVAIDCMGTGVCGQFMIDTGTAEEI